MTYTMRSIRNAAVCAVAGVTALTLAGCKMDVTNPSVIDAAIFDPATDATRLSISGESNLYTALSTAVVYGAYFSGEAWSGAAKQETNDFARRVFTANNNDINPNVWAPLSLAIASNEKVIQVLGNTTDAASNVNLARSAMSSGFALEMMAEYFCQGAMLVGPPMTQDQTLDSAIVRFKRAVAVGTAAAAEGNTEATDIVNASNVGLARTYLQKGDNASAAAAAALVPATFNYNAIYVDDPSNRDRVSNMVVIVTNAKALVVPPAYRAMNDARVLYADAGGTAQDGVLDLFVQTKYPDFSSPIRLASGLEASYIAAEAALNQGDPNPAITLIAVRRTAGGQSGVFVGGTPTQVLTELMDQRARDFWLEGKHLGDYRRNPNATPYVPASGMPYYKSQGDFGDLTCIPVPKEEINANPNFPRS